IPMASANDGCRETRADWRRLQSVCPPEPGSSETTVDRMCASSAFVGVARNDEFGGNCQIEASDTAFWSYEARFASRSPSPKSPMTTWYLISSPLILPL